MKLPNAPLLPWGKNAPKDDIFGLMLPSILGILLCAVCLVGSTFAWFSATRTVTVRPIQAASYTVTLDPADRRSPSQPQRLEPGLHELTLRASGTASQGYCLVQLGDTQYHTAPILPGSTFRLNLELFESVSLTITPQWGASPQSPSDWLTDGQTISYGAPPTDPPTEPTSEPTEPTSEPTEATSEPTEPSTEPTPEPTEPPTEPTPEPTEPTPEPTEPPTEATDPTEPAPEPTPEPSELTTEPTTEPTPEPTPDPPQE